MARTINKTTNEPANPKTMTEAQIERAVQKMSEEVRAEPKETIRIAHNPFEPSNQPQYVSVNGQAFYIPRGVSVTVPRCIATLLRRQGVI